jgi:hypothetical protein
MTSPFHHRFTAVTSMSSVPVAPVSAAPRRDR